MEVLYDSCSVKQEDYNYVVTVNYTDDSGEVKIHTVYKANFEKFNERFTPETAKQAAKNNADLLAQKIHEQTLSFFFNSSIEKETIESVDRGIIIGCWVQKSVFAVVNSNNGKSTRREIYGMDAWPLSDFIANALYFGDINVCIP